MTKKVYPTKYQLEHLKKRVASEIDPIIDEAKLMRKSIVANLTEMYVKHYYKWKINGKIFVKVWKGKTSSTLSVYIIIHKKI